MQQNKSRLRINQVSQLYGIGVDTLRYYEEIGLLTPKRNPDNNYRYYDGKDLTKLNIIRELRELHFSYAQIREAFHDRNLSATKEMLLKETSIIDAEITRMQSTKEFIGQRIKLLDASISNPAYDTIKIIHEPERKCLHIADGDIAPSEIDYYISSYIKYSNLNLQNMIGRSDGYRLAQDTIIDDYRYKICEVFIVNDFLTVEPSFTLPKGKYLSISYSGDQGASARSGKKLKKYIEEHNLRTNGDLFQFCVIDYYETNNTDEYITTLQIRIND